MLAKIAAFTESNRPHSGQRHSLFHADNASNRPTKAAEAIASVVENALQTVPCAAVFVPTRGGTTARLISRFRGSVWIVALCPDPAVCQNLAFSYGVRALHLSQDTENWQEFARGWVRENKTPGNVAMLVTGPSPRNPEANYRLEFMRVGH